MTSGGGRPTATTCGEKPEGGGDADGACSAVTMTGREPPHQHE
jgi:hypothetical protein